MQVGWLGCECKIQLYWCKIRNWEFKFGVDLTELLFCKMIHYYGLWVNFCKLLCQANPEPKMLF